MKLKYKLRAKLWHSTRVWALDNGQCFVKNQWNPAGFFCSQSHANTLISTMTGKPSSVTY